ncbi:acetyltransferase [Colletotrichum orchidophilum]|uniref:Acetyltransferase n=1 Tax=Colletotrichum orchidophilum TaxID=1209926 RepID=A0A1G4AND6_9PEZI|nr:acetyltransferase [Colletotrichum orchidophilum]OHE90631.1 acetyltransferase [Colletotrichum orchidophilum]
MIKTNIRDGGLVPHDAAFIVEAFDSTLAPLAAFGSGEMWGSKPFSEKEGFTEETLNDVETSERYRATGEGDALRVFIAEVEVGPSAPSAIAPHDAGQEEPGLRYRVADDGKRYLSVGTAVVRTNWLPGHVKAQFDRENIRDALEGKNDFVYLDVMVTDYRTGHHRKGVGEALIRRVKEYGVEEGMQVLYVDAWAGNKRKLIRFYE